MAYSSGSTGLRRGIEPENDTYKVSRMDECFGYVFSEYRDFNFYVDFMT
jgi:hypothetical protein